MRLQHVPETNSFGLVLPPSPEDLEYLQLFQRPKHKPDTVDRHNLYWPRSLYVSSALAQQFREHRFNSIWTLRRDHNSIHSKFDGVPIPPQEVMSAYLDEAELLDELGVCVRAVEMMDIAIYEGRVRLPKAIKENRQQKIETIQSTIELVDYFEVIPAHLARLAVQQFGELPAAA
jgi:hypothetical protein